MAKKTEASRQERKARKRAAEAVIPDIPGELSVDNDGCEDASNAKDKKSRKRKRDGADADAEDFTEIIDETFSKKIKKTKKEGKEKKKVCENTAVEAETEVEVREARNEKDAAKKEKRSNTDKELKPGSEKVELASVGNANTSMAEAKPALKKSKKDRKAERKAIERKNKDSNDNSVESRANLTDSQSIGKNNRNREKHAELDQAPAEDMARPHQEARFIVFVGNLPYTATKETVASHFAKLKPKSVRLNSKKEDASQTRGFAFVEFEAYDHMKTCLKLYHHSLFDDRLSEPRKINIELSAGGGGNTQDRRDKIRSKNKKLNDERLRRALDDEKIQVAKVAGGGAAIDESAVHPSRRRMVPS